MHDSGGFIDLRVGHGVRGIGDDSVWPSFTDIMTVIVMIFLMALVVMMVRNFELDRQLVTTVSAQEASAMENQTLADKLNTLEFKLLGLRQTLVASRGERDDLRAQLQEEGERMARMTADQRALEAQLAGLLEERNRLAGEKQEWSERARLAGENLAAAQADQEALSRNVRELTAQNQAAQARGKTLGERVAALLNRNFELDRARTQGRDRIAELTANEAKLSRKIAALSAQFNALEVRAEAGDTAALPLSGQLDAVASQLEQVLALLRAEQQQRRELGARVQAQDRALLARQAQLGALQSGQQQSAQRYAEASAEIDELSELIRRRQAENAALKALADAADARFRSLQEEYESLDAIYRNLVRPARSPAGKYAVDVRFFKSGGDYRFQLREPSRSAPVNYTRAELERRLAQLKDAQGKNLYTRVVIPEDSRLSHNEAWRFTQEILQGYDYYYQQYPDALGGAATAP